MSENTPGRLPTLLEYLRDDYLEKALPGGETTQPHRQVIIEFVEYAQQCIHENPPTQIFYAALGIGLVLADQHRVTVEMQPITGDTIHTSSKDGATLPAGDVPITGGEGFGVRP